MNQRLESARKNARKNREAFALLGQNIADLSQTIAQRIPYAVDELEMAATLESLGVSDVVARERFGAETTFALAQNVLTQLRASQPLRPQPSPSAYLAPLTPLWRDQLHGLGLLIGYGVVLLVIRYAGASGNLDDSQIIALSLGLTCAMCLSNGFSYALSRRASIYVGLEQRPAAVHFLKRTMQAALLTVIALVMGAAFLIAVMASWLADEGYIFLIAFSAWATIGISVAGLSLLRASPWFAMSLSAGSIVGVVADQIMTPLSATHLWLSALAGLLVVLATLGLGLKRAFAVAPSPASQRVSLPSAAYLAIWPRASSNCETALAFH